MSGTRKGNKEPKMTTTPKVILQEIYNCVYCEKECPICDVSSESDRACQECYNEMEEEFLRDRFKLEVRDEGSPAWHIITNPNADYENGEDCNVWEWEDEVRECFHNWCGAGRRVRLSRRPNLTPEQCKVIGEEFKWEIDGFYKKGNKQLVNRRTQTDSTDDGEDGTDDEDDEDDE